MLWFFKMVHTFLKEDLSIHLRDRESECDGGEAGGEGENLQVGSLLSVAPDKGLHPMTLKP